MFDFCIASPHKNELWYDYRVYQNLRNVLESMGHRYKAASHNRIYMLGGPQRQFYPEVGKFDPDANNLALIYCHVEKLQDISQFERVFVSSQPVKAYLEAHTWQQRFGALFKDVQSTQKYLTTRHPIEIIRPFSSLTPSSKKRPKFVCDIAFMGTSRIRPIVEACVDVALAKQLKMIIIGPNWDKYEGNPAAKKFWLCNSIPYGEIAQMAATAKICVTDHHDMMNQIPTVSHKYVDLVNAGAFVISDNNTDAIDYYGGVTFNDSNDLGESVSYYLQNEEARQAQIAKQSAIVKRHSSVHAAHSLARYFI